MFHIATRPRSTHMGNGLAILRVELSNRAGNNTQAGIIPFPLSVI